jgi:hypothetical protein
MPFDKRMERRVRDSTRERPEKIADASLHRPCINLAMCPPGSKRDSTCMIILHVLCKGHGMQASENDTGFLLEGRARGA